MTCIDFVLEHGYKIFLQHVKNQGAGEVVAVMVCVEDDEAGEFE